MAETMEVDLLVVGSGAAGMTAAIVAAAEGQRVLVLEKADVVGGSTAYSGGVCWVPGSHLARRAGVNDSLEKTLTYLQACLGERFDEERLRRYLALAVDAIEYLEARSEVAFLLRTTTPDYFSEREGGTAGGRALEALPYDARALGKRFADVRSPPPEYLVLGGMMVTVADATKILARFRTWDGFSHTAKLVARYALDRLALRRRGTRLVVGNALAARFYASLLKLKVPVWRSVQVAELLKEGSRITGARVMRNGQPMTVRARKGMVLATGGYPHNPQLRQRYFTAGADDYSAVPESATGDGIELALAAGAAMGPLPATPAFWSPVSVIQRADGSRWNFPHLMMDRSKPGVIAVNARGERFVNESTNYHDFTQAMLRQKDAVGSQAAFLVSSQAHLDRYCFGFSHPDAGWQRQLVKKGYMLRGDSLDQLAAQMKVPGEQLRRTVENFDRAAASGTDPAFGKGSTPYNRCLGDLTHQPNPCLAPLGQGPYYAIALQPGDIGTCHGLHTDLDARVLDDAGQPIEGLYACGNDMNSVMSGLYPGPGITLGPAIAFGYAAARHAAQRAA
ncbi:FAD-dependent oxidoreductase [Ottowia sp. VDI28]|uniref:FAD-dependent oxidoreductase n=1 Tax=Ottowia sp. VDI28 TaxID=3133968 RepID=UPI003C2C7E03